MDVDLNYEAPKPSTSFLDDYQRSIDVEASRSVLGSVKKSSPTPFTCQVTGTSTIMGWGGNHTVYRLTVKHGNSRWRIMRRYTEFDNLLKELEEDGYTAYYDLGNGRKIAIEDREKTMDSSAPIRSIFPSKVSNAMSQEVIDARKVNLSNFLTMVLEESETALHRATLQFLRPVRDMYQLRFQRTVSMTRILSSSINCIDPISEKDDFMPAVFSRLLEDEDDPNEDIFVPEVNAYEEDIEDEADLEPSAVPSPAPMRSNSSLPERQHRFVINVKPMKEWDDAKPLTMSKIHESCDLVRKIKHKKQITARDVELYTKAIAALKRAFPTSCRPYAHYQRRTVAGDPISRGGEDTEEDKTWWTSIKEYIAGDVTGPSGSPSVSKEQEVAKLRSMVYSLKNQAREQGKQSIDQQACLTVCALKLKVLHATPL